MHTFYVCIQLTIQGLTFHARRETDHTGNSTEVHRQTPEAEGRIRSGGYTEGGGGSGLADVSMAPGGG